MPSVFWFVQTVWFAWQVCVLTHCPFWHETGQVCMLQPEPSLRQTFSVRLDWHCRWPGAQACSMHLLFAQPPGQLFLS